jgi:hypothetical protein
MVFPGIQEVVDIPGVVEMAERITVIEPDRIGT